MGMVVVRPDGGAAGMTGQNFLYGAFTPPTSRYFAFAKDVIEQEECTGKDYRAPAAGLPSRQQPPTIPAPATRGPTFDPNSIHTIRAMVTIQDDQPTKLRNSGSSVASRLPRDAPLPSSPNSASGWSAVFASICYQSDAEGVIDDIADKQEHHHVQQLYSACSRHQPLASPCPNKEGKNRSPTDKARIPGPTRRASLELVRLDAVPNAAWFSGRYPAHFVPIRARRYPAAIASRHRRQKYRLFLARRARSGAHSSVRAQAALEWP